MKAKFKIQFNISIIIFIILCSIQNIHAQKKYKIDIMQEQCLEKESSKTTIGMVECIYKAQKEWDKELNKYYRLLMNKLSPNGKQKLRSSQRQWLKYRDKEFNFNIIFYHEMQGTIYSIYSVNDTKNFIKNRTLELKAYYDILSGNF